MLIFSIREAETFNTTKLRAEKMTDNPGVADLSTYLSFEST